MTQSTSATAGQKRWVVIALCVSLAINLLVAGVVIGARMHGGPPHAAMLNNSSFSVGRAIRQFDDERGAQLWPVARPHFKSIRPEMRKLRDAQQDWERSFASDPVDLADIDRSYAALHAQIAKIQDMNFGAIRALAQELSPEERKQLLRALRKPRRPHDHRPKPNREHDGRNPDSRDPG